MKFGQEPLTNILLRTYRCRPSASRQPPLPSLGIGRAGASEPIASWAKSGERKETRGERKTLAVMIDRLHTGLPKPHEAQGVTV